MMARFQSLAAALSTSVCIVALATPAAAQDRQFNVPAGSLKSALDAYVAQSGTQLIYQPQDLGDAKSKGVSGTLPARQALDRILAGSGYRAIADRSGALAIVGNGESGASGDSVASAVVVDAHTGANLKGARVEIDGKVVSTDDLGAFQIPGLRPGAHSVRISYLGYQDVVRTIQVGKGARPQRFEMESADGTEIVVYGSISARAQALNQERTSPVMSTVVSSDHLGQFTGTTISESLRRVPGVTFQRDIDTGDGTNIVVRGLAPDLNTVKLNGVELPESSGTGRSASLGNILTESIDSVTISKTLLPSQDSSGTGGLIEIETKSPLDRPRRYASITVEGAKRGDNFNDEFLASGTASVRLGNEDQFGLSASVQYRKRKVKKFQYIALHNYGEFLPLQIDNNPTVIALSQIDPRRLFPFEPQADTVFPNDVSYNLDSVDTENFGITVSGAWQVNSGTRIAIDYQRLQQNDTTVRIQSRFLAQSSYSLRPVEELNGELRRALTWNGRIISGQSYFANPDQESTTDVISLRGSSQLGKLSLNFGGGYTNGKSERPSSTMSLRLSSVLPPEFIQPAAVDPVEGRILSPFGPLNGDEIPLPLFTDAGLAFFEDPQNFLFTGGSSQTTFGKNRRYVGDLSAKYSTGWEILPSVEVGGSYESSRFTSNLSSTTAYQGIGSETAAELGLTFDEPMLGFLGIDLVNNISGSQLKDFLLSLDQIASSTTIDRFDFERDPRLRETYTDEGELALYAQAQLQFGNVEVLGGVRLSKVSITANNLRSVTLQNPDGSFDLEFMESSSRLEKEDVTAVEILPRVVVNYRPSESTVVRGGYYLSVARPQIQLLSSEAIVDLFLFPVFGPSSDQPALFVFKGNPELEPARTHSFDLSFEKYFGSVGAVKLGAFYKRIDNLLETNFSTDIADASNVALPDDPRFEDVKNNPDNYFISVTTPINNQAAAKIWGIEAFIERQLNFLPRPFDGLGIYANYTFTKGSKSQPTSFRAPVLAPDGSISGFENRSLIIGGVPLGSQSPHSGTFGLTYRKSGFDGMLSYTHQSRRLRGFSGHGLSSYEEGFGTLDFRAQYETKIAGATARFFAEATDLLRSPKEPSIVGTKGEDDGRTGKYYERAQYFGGRQFRLGISAIF